MVSSGVPHITRAFVYYKLGEAVSGLFLLVEFKFLEHCHFVHFCHKLLVCLFMVNVSVLWLNKNHHNKYQLPNYTMKNMET